MTRSLHVSSQVGCGSRQLSALMQVRCCSRGRGVMISCGAKQRQPRHDNTPRHRTVHDAGAAAWSTMSNTDQRAWHPCRRSGPQSVKDATSLQALGT
eukprot:5960881-Alexandrium_andersonii.AAC.1